MLREKPLQEMIDETVACLSSSLEEGLKANVIPQEMAERLDRDVFVFSGCKTYHELREASQLLRDPEGRIKPFRKFYEEVKAIHPAYNERYLEAEQEFAVHAAQSAAQWADIERDGDAYDLQYRTADDGKVRPRHAALHGVTRPQSDPCWSEIMPPNGWRCRCRVVQVRKGKYEYTDQATALQLGREATTDLDGQGRNRAEMFRFNPGKERVIFPRHHPYYNLSAKAKQMIGELADRRDTPSGFTPKTIAEAEELFRTQLGVQCRLDGFKKADLGQVREIFECVKRHFTDFPELHKEVHFVGSMQGRIKAFAEEFFREMRENPQNSWAKDEDIYKVAKQRARKIAYADCYAYHHSAGKEYGLDGVVFNSVWTGEKMAESLKKDLTAKFHPIGCDTVKSVFDHELAHCLDSMLGVSQQLPWQDWYNKADRKSVV